MARIPERKFDPSRPIVARKYFTANGRKYVPGDVLDWRKDAISQRRVMQMFEAGKLKHDATNTEPEVIVKDNTPERIDEEYTVERKDDDDLDAIDDMKELRQIANNEGAPYKVSKADQRQAIRDHRNKETD